VAPLNRAIGGRERFAHIVASGLGTGFVPVAAGTVGSLVALLIGAGLMGVSPLALPGAALLATFGGLWAVRVAGAVDDPGWVVIDEFAGQWIAMLTLRTRSPLALLSAFVLFRLIDIGKPGPIAWADRRKSAAGVMGDDVMAGGLAAGILWVVQKLWPGILG
jgi:phosphatidylglycerophosphatase A